MNILIITTEYGYDGGGMSLSCTRLMNILSSEHNVQVSLSTEYPIVTARGGINPATEDGIRKEYKLKEDEREYNNVDVVIGFGGRYNGYYASLLADRLEARFILNFRGSDINITKWSIDDSWYTIEACRRASIIVCLSQEMANNVLSIAPSTNGKVTIIPNELGQKKDSISFPNLPQKVVVGCAASHLNEKKGIGNLLYMLSDFKTIADIPITLELVGDIDSDLRDSYIAIINNLEITSNVVFHSYKTREELSNTMSNWDFYIQASVCEGHPNSITEALEKGHAFISSNTGFIAEQLYKEFPVLFFDSFNPKRMARQLLQLINMPNLKEFYEQSWNILERGCNKESVANKWHSLLSYDTSVPKQLGIENILAVGLHDVCGELHDSITTPITVFQQFVDFIHDGGYGLCSMRDYLGKTKEERERYIVCTFDDGYKNLLSVAMPILAKYGYTATVYVCTNLIGKDNKWNNKDATLRQHLDLDDIIKLKENGWEIASHGVTHRNLLKLSDKEVEYELSESKRVLSNIVGDVMTYAYPYGSYNRFIKFCVEKYYKYAFTVSQGGTSLAIDQLQLRRYSISDIYKMLSFEK